jgi:Effector-associated domain 11/SIR2-like domain
LIQIPFSAILSVNADNFYHERLVALGYNSDKAYFRGRLHGQLTIDKKPTPETPLIYNLFGSFEEHESMILDYTDLNKFLKSMMSLSESGLPNVVSDLLLDAKAFIFCGFEFNKWYSQLLLRLLTKGAQKKFVIKESDIESSSKIFLEKGFSVNFLDVEDGDVLDMLVAQFAEKGSLRHQKAPLSKEQRDLEQIHDFIEEDNLDGALQFMEKLAEAKNDTEFVNNLVIQKGRIAEATRDKDLGSMTTDDFKSEKNKIRIALLNLAQELCEIAIS